MIELLLAALITQKPLTVKATGEEFAVILDRKSPEALRVERNGKLVASDVPRRWKPWKLELADVDGDGQDDILVGLIKATHNLPRPHTCLYVYGFNGVRIYPKWRGSSMGRPLVDFATHRFGQDPYITLITVERLLGGKLTAGAWKWNGFGFKKLWESGAWKSARLVGFQGDMISIRVDRHIVSINGRKP